MSLGGNFFWTGRRPTALSLGYADLRALMKTEGLAGAQLRTPFDLCMGLIALWECRDGDGGHISDDPADPGGLTVYGLAQASHDWVSRDMSWETAINAYRDLYWSHFGLEGLDFGAALLAFDCVVKHGQGARLIQEGLNRAGASLVADNAMGEATHAALDVLTAAGVREVTLGRITYVHSLGPDLWARFGHGWARRYADVGMAAMALL